MAHALLVDGASEQVWTPFECDGHSLEYAVVDARQRTRSENRPSHKRSPGASVPVVLVAVRKAGTETGPAMVYPEGTVVTIDHAIETARFFRDRLV
jgi:hypothetical protein